LTLSDAGARLFAMAMRFRANRPLSYALAVGSFLLALGVRFAINDLLPAGFPYLTFFPAVLLTALLGGLLPGVLCAVLSILAAWYWFIAPAHSFALDLQSTVAVLFFVFVLSVDLFIIHVMTIALERVVAGRRSVETLLDNQKGLFQELQHRTANNFSFIAALLSMHRRRAAGHPEVVAAFEDATVRLETMSRVHRRLYDPSSLELPLEGYFRALVTDMLEASGRTGVAIDVSVDAPPIDLNRLQTLSLVVIEIVTNSLKHAFADGRGGRIGIALGPAGSGRLELVVRDDGPGFPAGFDPAATDRLGTRILMGFARTLGGEIDYESGAGAVVRLNFPADPRP
jgi:two-component sensor histidine kinase